MAPDSSASRCGPQAQSQPEAVLTGLPPSGASSTVFLNHESCVRSKRLIDLVGG